VGEVSRYAIAGLALVCAVPVLSQDTAMLSRLEAGQWELRGAGNARIAAICLGNPMQLTQPYHRGVSCARDVIAADARSMTVSYSCPGIGRGRTEIRFETPRLIQIESQGLDRGTPFAVRAEARRIGPC
jgi:hypothetical protein